jgi:hypothetical protein
MSATLDVGVYFHKEEEDQYFTEKFEQYNITAGLPIFLDQGMLVPRI